MYTMQRALLTDSFRILSYMTSGGTWKSKTKYCREEKQREAGDMKQSEAFLLLLFMTDALPILERRESEKERKKAGLTSL